MSTSVAVQIVRSIALVECLSSDNEWLAHVDVKLVKVGSELNPHEYVLWRSRGCHNFECSGDQAYLGLADIGLKSEAAEGVSKMPNDSIVDVIYPAFVNEEEGGNSRDYRSASIF